MIIDRLYPEDDEKAFNEVSSISSNDLLSRIQTFSLAQDKLKQETSKLSEGLKDLSKTFQPTINQIAQNTSDTLRFS